MRNKRKNDIKNKTIRKNSVIFQNGGGSCFYITNQVEGKYKNLASFLLVKKEGFDFIIKYYVNKAKKYIA